MAGGFFSYFLLETAKGAWRFQCRLRMFQLRVWRGGHAAKARCAVLSDNTLWPGSATGCVVVSHIRQAALGAARPMEMGVAMRMLHKPGATEHVTLPGEEIRNVELGFKLADVTAARQGDDLALSFADGARLVFSEYFQIHDGNFPELNFADGMRHLGPDDIRTDWERPHDKAEAEPGGREDGSDGAQSGVSADSGADARASAPEQGTPSPAQEAQIQAALQQNDAPRAGPNSPGSVQESNYHAWEELDLLDGRPHLGPLDIGWNRGWNQKNLHTSAGRRDDGEDASILDGNAVVSPAPGDQPLPSNALPIIDGADVALEVREAGVRGNDPDLGHLTDPNAAYDGKITANGSADALDPDGDALTWLVRGTGGSGASAETNYGSVSISPDGSYTYTLNESRSNVLAQGETKTDSFVVLVSDGRGGTAEETVVVTITGTNDAPVLDFKTGDGTHTLSARNNGDSAEGALRVDDPDSDGAPGQSVGGAPSQQFSIAGGGGTTGTPAQGVDGSATFTTTQGVLTVHADGRYAFEYTGPGVGADTTLHFVVNTTDAHDSVSNEKIITVTLTPNQPPVVTSTDHTHALTESGVEDGGNVPFTPVNTVSGTITAEDADNDSLTYAVKNGSSGVDGSSTKNGVYGTLIIDKNGGYTYELDNAKDATQKLISGEMQDEIFTITVSDGHGGSVEQTITVAVTGTNDVPVLSFKPGSTGAHTFTDNGKAQTDKGAFVVTDPDADGALGKMVAVDGESKAGQSFSIAGSDGTVGSGGVPNTDGGTSFSTECGVLTILKDGSYTYRINPDSEKVIALGGGQTHTEHFTVTVTDAHGAVSGTLPITVEITGKDDPPKISGDTGAHSLREEGVEQGSNTPLPGEATATGTLTAEHTDGDATGGISYDLKATVVINGTSVIADKSTDINGVISLKTDYGTLYLTAKDGVGVKYDCDYRFELDNDSPVVNALANGTIANLNFKVQATDSSGPRELDLNFSVTGTNDRPEITDVTKDLSPVHEDAGSGQLSVSHGQAVADDVDAGDSLSYSLINSEGAKVQILIGAYGRLEVEPGTGKYTYYLDNDKAQSLAEGQTGQDEFVVRVTDKLGAYVEETIRIPIIGKDDAPVLGNLAGTLTEDNGSHDSIPLEPGLVTTKGGKVTATDTDTLDTEQSFVLKGSVDNASAAVTDDGNGIYTVAGKYGTLTFHSDGSYTYQLDKNQSGDIQKLNEGDSLNDSFHIAVTTGHSGIPDVTDHSSSSQGNLVITIQGSNDNPVIIANDYNLKVNEDDTITIETSGQLQISDIDADETVSTNSAGEIISGAHTFYFLVNGEKVQSVEGDFGVLTVNQFTGNYTYVLNQYADGLDKSGNTESFTIYVEDGHQGTASQEITVDVGQLTSPPDSPGGEGYTLTGSALDVTEDGFTSLTNVQGSSTATHDHLGDVATMPFGFNDGRGNFTLTVSGEYGVITINKETGEYTYTLNNDLSSVQSLSVRDSLTEIFQLWGSGSGTIEVTIKGSNDQPEVTLKMDNPPFELTQKDGKASSAHGQALVTDTDTANSQAEHTSDTHTFWLDAACAETEIYYKFTVTDGKVTGFEKYTGSSPEEKGGADYKVSIDDQGQYTLTYLKNGKHLTQDDSTTVSFKVYAKDDSGAANAVSEPIDVTATIKGTNAAPVWGDVLKNSVTEDDGNLVAPPGQITCAGNFLSDGNVSDDTGNSGLSFNIVDPKGGQTSLVSNDFGTLQITDSRTGAYAFTLNNENEEVQALAQGESKEIAFTIMVTDKHGGHSEQTFTITINGTNDAPALDALDGLAVRATADSDAKADSATLTAAGKDVDHGDTLTYSQDFKGAYTNEGVEIPGAKLEDYGSFTIDPDTGKYYFTLDNSKDAVKGLSDGETIDLHFTLTVTDQHGAASALAPDATHNLTVHISGINDAPEVIAGQESALATMPHSGDFDTYIQDPDWVKGTDKHQEVTFSASHENGNSGTDIDGQYGSLHIGDDGKYTYTPNSGSGPVYDESFVLHARDQNGVTTDVEIVFQNTGGTAPTALSLSSLLADVPGDDDSPLLSSLIAENTSLDNLLGGADNVSAPADPATLPGTETPYAVAPLSAPVELAAPSGGQEEAVARMMVEQAV